MSIQNDHINILLTRYLDRKATMEEEQELMDLVLIRESREDLMVALKTRWDEMDTVDTQFNQNTGRAILNTILEQQTHQPIMHRVHFLRTAWFRVAVIILLFSGIGAYLWQTNRSNPVSADEASAKPVQNDIMPGSDKAILILSDGRKIILDSTAGKTITEGDLQIQNNNNGLIYSSSDIVVNNTMTTPKGGQYQLTLADGTKVWLNAASSITYPTAFKVNTREVSVRGEVYFEIKANKEKPFIIKTRDQKIEVLGTELNVNTYEDEKTKISLVNGAIKINNKVLKPGQALMDGNIQSTNIEQDIAWKKGIFNFQNIPLEQAMRQLARWYDVDIAYQGKKRRIEFKGEIDRALTLQEVLSGLEGIGRLHFQLKEKTIIIDYR